MNITELHSSLCSLLPAEFEILIIRLRVPEHILSGSESPRAIRAKELIQWASQRELITSLKEEISQLKKDRIDITSRAPLIINASVKPTIILAMFSLVIAMSTLWLAKTQYLNKPEQLEVSRDSQQTKDEGMSKKSTQQAPSNEKIDSPSLLPVTTEPELRPKRSIRPVTKPPHAPSFPPSSSPAAPTSTFDNTHKGLGYASVEHTTNITDEEILQPQEKVEEQVKSLLRAHHQDWTSKAEWHKYIKGKKIQLYMINSKTRLAVTMIHRLLTLEGDIRYSIVSQSRADEAPCELSYSGTNLHTAMAIQAALYEPTLGLDKLKICNSEQSAQAVTIWAR